MTWLTDCAEHIEDTLTGYTVGTNVFYTFMPDTPDAALGLYDAGGSLTPNGPDVPLQEVRLEVRVRAAADAAAQTLVASVVGALHCKTDTTWNSTTRILFCRLENEPALLKRDSVNRPVYLLRFVAQVFRASYKSTS